jgi:hypothetical protein
MRCPEDWDSDDSDYDGAYDYDDQPFMRRPWSDDT